MFLKFKQRKDTNRPPAPEAAPRGGIGLARNVLLSVHFRLGDPGAFEQAYRNFRRPIFALVLSRISDRHTAEELTQEIFFKAFRARGTFDPRFEFSTWLWTIARNTLSDWFRKNHRASALAKEAGKLGLEPDEIPSLHPDPESALITAGERDALARVMQGLTELQKKALVLRLTHQLPYREIARRLGLSLSAAKCLVHRARVAIGNRALPGTIFRPLEA